MSSNKTPNLNLHSWLGTDKFNYNEMNENFNALDSEIKNLQNKDDSLDSAIETLESNLNVALGKTSTLYSAKVYVEKYPRLEGETDDTARIQRAFDDAVEYAEIVFDPNIYYYFTSILSTKSLTVNFNGASMTVNPYSTQTPAIWFKGTVGTQYSLNTDLADNARVIDVTDASTLFAKHDYIIIGDVKAVPQWANSSITGYTGRSEINQVESISGNSITLAKAVEWPYLIADGSYVQKVTKFIDAPRIMNSGVIKEVDPGVVSTSSPALAGKGHILQFEYAIQPKVENIKVDGWQMHAVNFYRCTHHRTERVRGYKPFRPAEGGHGYLIKIDNSWGGIDTHAYGLRTRHLIDWSRSYDCMSKDCFAMNPDGVSFYTHGLGSKRIKSIDDTVMGAVNAVEGWAMGNPGFAADYDMEIINPKYFGVGIALGMKTGSDGLRVINPSFKSNDDYVVGITRGAKNFSMLGGEIENYSATGVNRFAILVAGATGGSAVIEYPRDITIRDTKIKGNGIVSIEAQGTVVVEDMDFDVNIMANGGLAGALRICENSTPSLQNLIVRRNRMMGAFDRGIYGSYAPTGSYVIEDNYVEGYRTGGIQLRAANNLVDKGNKVVYNGSSAERGYSGSISDSVLGGAVIKDNIPNQTYASGVIDLSGVAATYSYIIPHPLITKPSKFTVTCGNSVAGTAEINYITPWSTNLTVSFKNVPAVGTNNIKLYWTAEV